MSPDRSPRKFNIFFYTWQPLALLVCCLLILTISNQYSASKKDKLIVDRAFLNLLESQNSSLAEEAYLVRHRAISLRLNNISSSLKKSLPTLTTVCLKFKFTNRENIQTTGINYCDNENTSLVTREIRLGDMPVGYLSYGHETSSANFGFLNYYQILFSLLLALLFHLFFSTRVNKKIVLPLLSKIQENASLQAQAIIAKQVAHDMRSPISTLLNIINVKSTTLDHEDAVIQSLNRLNSIAQNLLDVSRNPKSFSMPNNQKLQLVKLISHLSESKKLEFQSKEIHFDVNCSEDYYLWFNPLTLERIISNCWNNSIEATSNQFVKLGIHVSQGGNSMTISMTDNGPGFPETFFRNLDEGIILTTKPTGNGIGLNYAISSLRDEDAKLQFNNLLNGAEVRIVFSDRNISKKDDPVVLIDDDKYVRYSWAVNAEKLGINIHSFSSIEDFQDRSSEYDSKTEIFIDSDLGRDKRGEDYIKHLFNLGFHRLNIQTGSEPCDFQDITHLNSIVSKTFPY